MKILIFASLFVSLLINELIAQTTTLAYTDPEVFGKEVFYAIKKNDYNKMISFLPTAEDIEYIRKKYLDNHPNEGKNDLNNELSKYQKETISRTKMNFDKLRKEGADSKGIEWTLSNFKKVEFNIATREGLVMGEILLFFEFLGAEYIVILDDCIKSNRSWLIGYIKWKNDDENLLDISKAQADSTVLANSIIEATDSFKTASLSDYQNEIEIKFQNYINPQLNGRKLNIKIYEGDINGDDKKDFVIDYCIVPNDNDIDAGGGNALSSLVSIESGIAIYTYTNNDYILKLKRTYESFIDTGNFYIKGIFNEKILIETTEYGPDDPRCCPSIKKNIYYKYSNGNLIKI